MTLESKLVKSLIVEGAKLRGQTTKRPDKSELRRDLVNDETEPNLLRKLETVLGFTLHLRELIPSREKVRDQVVTAISRKGKITDLVRGIEGATYQIATGLAMSRPWDDDISEPHISSSLKTIQSAFLDQIITELIAADSGRIVTEARSG